MYNYRGVLTLQFVSLFAFFYKSRTTLLYNFYTMFLNREKLKYEERSEKTISRYLKVKPSLICGCFPLYDNYYHIKSVELVLNLYFTGH